MKKISLLIIILFGSFLLNGQDAESMFEQSKQLSQEGKYEEAVVLLESIKPHFKKNSKDYAIILNSIGLNYSEMGNYSNAESSFLEALKILKKVSKKNNNEYATISNNLGFLYSNTGDYANAEKYYLEAKTIWGKFLGNTHPHYATSINNLGHLYNSIGDYAQAEKCYLEALSIREKVFGKEHLDYANSLNNIGIFYSDIGDYAKSEKYLLETLSIREKVLGKGHQDCANSLNNLGTLYSDISDYVKAEKYLLEALLIREKIFGKEHPDYANSLNNLGYLYRDKSDYAQAKKYLLDALSITEKVFGKEHPDYAIFLNNIGSLYSKIGDYAQAEKCYVEAKTIDEKVLGKEHPDYATSLNNLGLLYNTMGDYGEAEKYLLEANTIFEKVLGKEHFVYASSLNNLGLLYDGMGDYAQAEKCYLEALKIKEKVLGNEHPDYALLLSNMGFLYKSMGDFQKAKRYYLEALSIREKVLGNEHPDYANSLNNLGTLHIFMGDYAQAERYSLETLIIYEKVLGKEHPDYASSLGNLALLYYQMGNIENFETLISETYKIKTEQVEKNFTFLSDRQRNLFWEKEKNSFEVAYSLAYSHPTTSMTPLVYNNTLFTKGLLLRTATGIRDAIYTSGDADLIANFEQLGNIRQQINALQTKEKPDLTWISALENRADSLDKIITIASSDYRELKEDLKIGWNDIQKHLNPNEIAIEFVNFNLFNKQLGLADSVMYCAMLIRNNSDAPEYLPLFEQSQLLELLKDENSITSTRIQKLYNGGNPRLFNGQKLYDLIWKPLENHLEGVETVYYSPAGLLNRISFAAIPVDTVCLIDKYDLQLLSSTREIVHKSKKTEEFLPLNFAVIYGGIEYDIQDTSILISSAEKYKKSENELVVTRSLPNDATRSVGWEALPGTKTEVNEIEKLLQQSKVYVTKYMDFEANEESFKNLSGNSPQLLHVATHGFFLENEKEIQRNLFMQLLSENSNTRNVSNPLLRSGLLLAGANRAWTNKEVIAGIEDGILTAEEISNLNLTHTKLVVLSACKTGLGAVDNSEGVFGLQRSFKLAGVETLVMSLWEVDDKATCQFMLTFYHNLLEGKTKLESFHIAQKQIREQYKNPYFWAAFVMMD